jgi:predicted metal-dependent hydrolase
MSRIYADGEKFPYRGTSMSLRVENATEISAEKPRVAVREDACIVVRAPDADCVKKFILYWYTSETEKIARELVPAWSKRLSVRPRMVEVKYAKTRWGSCSIRGRIFLNSRLAMLSDEVAEYIVVHELCHMKQMNHGKEFWNEVRAALPSAMALRRSLRVQELYAVL